MRSPLITAAAAGGKVRFSCPGETAQIRVRITSDAGHPLFDSAWRDGNVLDWPIETAGQPLANGSYRCVVMVKDLDGEVTQKEVTLIAQDAAVMIAGAEESDPKVTLLAHDDKNGAIVSTSGDLSFRFGKFLAGQDSERMRLTAAGDLEVNGLIRAGKGIRFADGTILTTAPGEGTTGESGGVVRQGQGTPGMARNAGALKPISGAAGSLTPQPAAFAPAFQFVVGDTGVQVGTTNPAFKLDVTGALTVGGKIDQTSIDGLVVRGTFGSGNIPATGAGTRLVWYPGKAAFRAGGVNGMQWDSPGNYSVAMGLNTTAAGGSSTAMGEGTTVTGCCSTAMGFGSSVSGDYSTAMGYFTSASGSFGATAMGANTVASGGSSTAMGAFTTASGLYSVAMGSYASTTSGGFARAGAFVFGDNSTTTLVTPSANNQFVVRAAGGTTFFSNAAMSTGVSLAADGTSWASVSDRNRKEDFRPIDQEEILNKLAALPVTSWRYKNDNSGQRYIGPMAQDFHALFGLGTDTTIATLDVDGVTLAGIKALERRTADLQAENTTLRDQLERLMRRVEQLEAHRAMAK